MYKYKRVDISLDRSEIFFSENNYRFYALTTEHTPNNKIRSSNGTKVQDFHNFFRKSEKLLLVI